MIRVAMDARRLQDSPLTGVGRMLANLIPHLAREVDLILLTDAGRPRPRLPFEFVSLPGLGLPEPAWLHVSARRWLHGFDGVFHGPYNALPFGYAGPTVVTLHDLAQFEHGEDLPLRRRVLYRTQSSSAVARCARVICHSEFVRGRVIARWNLPTERLVLAPPGIDSAFSPERAAAAAPILAELGVSGPYVLTLGGAPRRGADVAVEAWRRLPRGPGRPTMVVMGHADVAPEAGLVKVDRLDDAAWTAVLAAASVFCYPTRYEGYGMPAIEAAASGVPVVCAKVGPLPEVLGDAAEWCAAPTVEQIAPALARVVGDPERAQSLRQAGLRRASAAVSWAESAALIVKAYEDAAQ